MTTTSRILIGTIVAMVVVAAGFVAGLKFHEKRNIIKTVFPAAKVEAHEKQPLANMTTYEISPPSLGVMLETYAVNITPTGQIARIELPTKDAQKIKTGQRVFLFDTNGEMLDSLGTVMGIMPSGNFTLVELNLRNNPDVWPGKVTKGKIIIDRNTSAFRLPYSALSRNEKGETFVWEVTNDSDGTYTVKYKPVDIKSTNDAVFSIETDPQASNLFILNPDFSLRDGQTINVRKFLYKPPSQHEDARIQSIVEKRLRDIESRKELPPLEEPLSDAAAPSASFSSCEQSGNVAQDFINKIKTLSEAPAQPPVSP